MCLPKGNIIFLIISHVLLHLIVDNRESLAQRNLFDSDTLGLV